MLARLERGEVDASAALKARIAHALGYSVAALLAYSSAATARNRVMTGWDDLPLVMTLDQARSVLNVGRTTTYALARQFVASGGQEGLPVVLVGGTYRITRDALARFVGLHPINVEAPAATEAPVTSISKQDDHTAA
jgi:hypothetical protein